MILRTFFILSILYGLCNAGLLEDWERAKEIAESRVEYYKVRQELFEGTDDASKGFQSGFSAENTKHIAIANGLDSILRSIFSGQGFGNDDVLGIKKRRMLILLKLGKKPMRWF